MNEAAPPRILVVDDDATTRILAQAGLAPAGFEVVEAEDGVEAVRMLRLGAVDVVLLDVDMPGMDGFETCRQIREQLRLHNLPVLMTTAMDDVASIERAYAVGATDFTTKPVNWTLLGHRLRYIIRANEALGRLAHTVAELKRSKAALTRAQRVARIGSWSLELLSGRVDCSEETRRILGLRGERELPTLAPIIERVHPDDRSRFEEALQAAVERGEPVSLEHRVLLADGEERVIDHALDPALDHGEVLTVDGTVQDVTERRIAEERVRKLAYFDGLTGLPNRETFLLRLREEVDRAGRTDQRLAVLFVDLDDFKRVNDTLGHDAGDELLREVSRRLNEGLRSSDTVMRTTRSGDTDVVARLGGDEFTVLLCDVQRGDDAALVAERLMDLVAEPIFLAGEEVRVTPSIGIAVYPEDGLTPEDVLKSADMAMYHAKHHGKNLVRFLERQ